MTARATAQADVRIAAWILLGDNSGVDITPDLLELMNLQFFGPGIDHVNVTVSNSNQTEESNEP